MKLKLAALAACALTALGAAAHAEVETRAPIKVLMINSSDGDFIAAVYGEVLKEVGYRVEYVQADYTASYTALAAGDIDASLAGWQSVGPELTDAAVATGNVTNYGPTGVKVTEGWWYSNATLKSCPTLPDWQALLDPACIAALSTAETAPNGRYLDAPADWETGTDKRIADLGLKLVKINSGSAATLIASVKGALDRGEPILAWGYQPHWLFTDAVGQFVNTPGHERNKDILKLGYTKTFERAVIAGAILKAYDLPTSAVEVGMDQIDNQGMKPEDAARAWMDANTAVWQAWVPK